MVSRRVILAALLGLAACKPKTSGKPPLEEGVVLKVPLVVRASEDCNYGRPLRVVVRGIGRKSFIEDDYATIAGLVIEPDESVVARLIVFPDKDYVVDLKFAKRPEVIAVYGLFSRTDGESWKLMFEDVDGLEVIDLNAGVGGFTPVE